MELGWEQSGEVERKSVFRTLHSLLAHTSGQQKVLVEKRSPAGKGKFMLTFGFISSASNSAVSAQPPHSCPVQPAGLRCAPR